VSFPQGAPLATCPFRDDPVMADDPNRNNDFDYVVRNQPDISPNEPSDYYCPYTIHTRKTAPRNLEPYINAKYLEAGSIVRGGLPYGGEVRQILRTYDITQP
jgi:deferrochelatase/peroxidase EfeB